MTFSLDLEGIARAYSAAGCDPPHVAPNGSATLLRSAGVAAWALVGLPVVIPMASAPTGLSTAAEAWLVGFAFFGIGFWRVSGAIAFSPDDRPSFAWLGVQTVAALSMLLVACTGFESLLVVLVAAQLGLILPRGPALAWLVCQTIVLGALSLDHFAAPAALRWTGGTLGAQLLAFFLGAMTRREARARTDEALATSALRATQQMLAESAKETERLRISRELHDLVGHDLTALRLNLELARHTAGQPRALRAIETAQELAARLLQDVRLSVGHLRDTPGVDLEGCLNQMAREVTDPRVQVDVRTRVTDPGHAQALLRCAQEAITNAAKHASATLIRVTISRDGPCLVFEAEDDGRGALPGTIGNGLRGMRERLEEVGGTLEVHGNLGRGFRLRATIPVKDRDDRTRA